MTKTRNSKQYDLGEDKIGFDIVILDFEIV
jgi:hypothetical protein